MDAVPIPDGVAQANGGRRVIFSPPGGDLTGNIRACEAVVMPDSITVLIALDAEDRRRAAAGLPIWLTILGAALPPFGLAFADPLDPADLEQFEDEGDLHLAGRPADDGTFQLFYIDRSGCTVKCGYVHPDAAVDVRRKLARS